MSTLSQSYNDLGEPETDSWSGGPLAGHSVTTSRDSFGRRQGVTASVAGQRWKDGLWTYTWDAENRLISMQSQALVPTAGRRKLDFEYDPLGRRIGRIVSTGASGSWVPTSTTRWLYEGWNPVAELNGAGTLVREYVWGTDLSGSWQGAGGVGGLLWVLEAPAGPSITAHYAAYDGNGNVMGLVNAADGTWSARYEYGPFGEVIRATGAMAVVNPFRWSTKIQDEDSGLNYYGYRYYSAGVGRWLGRDPLGESESRNLFASSDNSPLNFIDSDGRQLWMPPSGPLYNSLPTSAQPSRPPPAVIRPTKTRMTGEHRWCCGDFSIWLGERILQERYRRAVDDASRLKIEVQLPSLWGKKKEAVTATCKGSSADVLEYLVPTPQCWQCYLEERNLYPPEKDPLGDEKDHQVVICIAWAGNTIKREIMFDWWGDKVRGRTDSGGPPTGFRSEYPYPSVVAGNPLWTPCGSSNPYIAPVPKFLPWEASQPNKWRTGGVPPGVGFQGGQVRRQPL